MQQTDTIHSIMLDFAYATGLTDTSREPRRYLWTDAFALCNYLQLYRQTNESLLDDIERCLQAFVTSNQLRLPAEYRLAFRELGLTIGLHAIGRMLKTIEQHPEKFTNSQQLSSTLNNLSRFHRMYEFIENFWLEAEHRSVNSWQEHADINNVMLATSLAPDGYL